MLWLVSQAFTRFGSILPKMVTRTNSVGKEESPVFFVKRRHSVTAKSFAASNSSASSARGISMGMSFNRNFFTTLSFCRIVFTEMPRREEIRLICSAQAWLTVDMIMLPLLVNLKSSIYLKSWTLVCSSCFRMVGLFLGNPPWVPEIKKMNLVAPFSAACAMASGVENSRVKRKFMLASSSLRGGINVAGRIISDDSIRCLPSRWESSGEECRVADFAT